MIPPFLAAWLKANRIAAIQAKLEASLARRKSLRPKHSERSFKAAATRRAR